MKMTGAEIFVKALEDLGVDIVFGYPGGAVLNIYDALFQNTKIRHLLVRHEQGGVHMADGYARASGKNGRAAGRERGEISGGLKLGGVLFRSHLRRPVPEYEDQAPARPP